MASSKDIHSTLLAEIANLLKILDHEGGNLDHAVTHKVENSLNAIKDISSLWQAHTTKLALAFKPPISGEAALKCLEEAGKLPRLLVAAYNAIDEDDKTGLMKPEVKDHIDMLFLAENSFLEELKEAVVRERLLLQNLRPASADSNARTLVSVGEVWESCKKLQALIDNGPVAVLQGKITAYSGIIRDAVEEFKELMEEEREDSDDENNDDDVDKPPSAVSDSEEVDDFEEFNFSAPSKPLSKELRQVGIKWKDMFIRLPTVTEVLCKTLCKRLENTESTKIIKINTCIKSISEATDDLVFGFSDNSITDVKEGFVVVTKELETIADLTTRPDDNFSTQLRAYIEKFKANNS
ncbi:hypothetical protein AWJ20_3948 [Sugiyamaella lignohabitans]|uniref:Cyclin-D1-binding protein 1-like N-terminal domain-containing protein n=1 Tax=Sugiyamaella lignohabitans TaxID=796027 RepID=A0A161HIT1_9ASCO|nr:uncharacterized protein AWJ20_3948 [Sugiyamaella lignohabitans]ANB11148.1 hypothetical protein AWJ20_3948 [Sugiyamaella lignohabitans]